MRCSPLGCLLLISCAHPAPPVITRVDSEWVRPRLDEAAIAAARCVSAEPDRSVEIELGRDGTTRAFVNPAPVPPAMQRCADEAARAVPHQPVAEPVRTMLRGDGTQIALGSERGRALALRARAVDQVAPIEQCRQALLQRRPRTEGRVGLVLTADEDGHVTSVELPASTLDEPAGACVLAAARALELPPIPGTYRYSYLLGPRGVLVGAPDVDPIDPAVLSGALDAIRPTINVCLALYRTPSRVLVKVRFGNDGVPMNITVDRETGTSIQVADDVRADACVRRAAATLRVIPFDGPPAERTLPFSLR